MKSILCVGWQKFCALFTKKGTLGSSQAVYHVNHIHDETVSWPNGALMWANVHGFTESPDKTYWVGIDVRSFGIRTADYIIKCKSKAVYDDYIYLASHDTPKVLYKMRDDSRLNYKPGNNVNIEYVFDWGGERKTFDVHLRTDHYAEEK